MCSTSGSLKAWRALALCVPAWPHAQTRTRSRDLPKHQEQRSLGPLPKTSRGIEARCLERCTAQHQSITVLDVSPCRMDNPPIRSQVQGGGEGEKEWRGRDSFMGFTTRAEAELRRTAPITELFHELQSSFGQDSALDVDPSWQHQARLRSKKKKSTVPMGHLLASRVASAQSVSSLTFIVTAPCVVACRRAGLDCRNSALATRLQAQLCLSTRVVFQREALCGAGIFAALTSRLTLSPFPARSRSRAALRCLTSRSQCRATQTASKTCPTAISQKRLRWTSFCSHA